MSWRTTTDAAEFVAAAGDYLTADPVENTVLLSIADSVSRAAPPPEKTPLFGWLPAAGPPTAAAGPPSAAADSATRTAGSASPVAAFVHSPGWPVVLSPMSEATAVGLAVHLLSQDRPLTGVNGAPEAAQTFAAQWRPAATAQVYQRQRLFRLAELTPPAAPPGRARVAAAADRDQLIDWYEAFEREADTAARGSGGPAVDARLAYGGQLVWEIGGELVATAARTRVLGAMARVAPVYTPLGQRGKGYGGAVTVAVSQAARVAGAREVVLFTDLANPTSNALYQRLGYRPVSDRLVLSFTAA
ncbi:MAG: GNAT family N-acetyltransferase [Actinobacteria bacterium]|nr:GNAT family N-acetyltransferase [Actinomycetota bacterium]